MMSKASKHKNNQQKKNLSVKIINIFNENIQIFTLKILMFLLHSLTIFLVHYSLQESKANILYAAYLLFFFFFFFVYADRNKGFLLFVCLFFFFVGGGLCGRDGDAGGGGGGGL